MALPVRAKYTLRSGLSTPWRTPLTASRQSWKLAGWRRGSRDGSKQYSFVVRPGPLTIAELFRLGDNVLDRLCPFGGSERAETDHMSSKIDVKDLASIVDRTSINGGIQALQVQITTIERRTKGSHLKTTRRGFWYRLAPDS